MEFEKIYERYFKDIFLFLKGLSSSEIIAEEIAQETFFKALKSIDHFDGSKDIRAWLFTIARNTYYSHYKEEKRYVEEQAVGERTGCGVNVLDRMVDEDTAFMIHQYLHQMDEPYKEVFCLRVFGELPFEKIGMIFGKNASWARVTFYRAKMRIQRFMEGQENEN